MKHKTKFKMFLVQIFEFWFIQVRNKDIAENLLKHFIHTALHMCIHIRIPEICPQTLVVETRNGAFGRPLQLATRDSQTGEWPIRKTEGN